MIMKKSGVYVKIINYSLVIFILVTLLAAVIVMFFRMSGSALSIGGMRLLRIVSGSMEPIYKAGDYVVSFETETDKLTTDDIIAFVSDEGETTGEVIVHRIVSVGEDGTFITRGDANPIDDYSTVKVERIIGKAAFHISVLKYADKLFSGIWGFVALIVLPLLFMIINEALHLVRTGKKRREINALIIKYGLDPDDERLYGIAEKYGEEAVRSIAGAGSKRVKEKVSDEK
jgi:signal peptidase I